MRYDAEARWPAMLAALLRNTGHQVMPRGAAREIVSLVNACAGLPNAWRHRTPGVTEARVRGDRHATEIATPVVLVHGYLGTEAPWAPLARRLQTEGYHHVYTVRYDSLSAGIPELAASLTEAVRRVMSGAGQPDVHLVGHSLGGLVARYAVQRLGLDEVTRSVLTVATPHHGTRVAWCGPGPAAAALRPGSALLRGLPAMEETPRVRWAVLTAGADLLIPAAPPGEGVALPGYGHHSVLASAELAEHVVDHLRGSERRLVRPEGAAREPAA
jgi:pimeloyl-ACP methyl ester carboxylesterase